MTIETIQDKIRGCLIGGAIGDALGYPVEFFPWKYIVERYSKGEKRGITEYHLDSKTRKAVFSDDTQMTLFTANGILVNETAKQLGSARDNLKTAVYEAYLEWYRTQTSSYPNHYRWRCSWLMEIPELFEARGPGNTCMEALGSGECGSIKYPINNSSGNGGLMRVAPYGCYFRDMSERELIMAAAESTAITHGNSLGYIPSGMMALIVRKCIYEDHASLREIILSSYRATGQVFSADPQWPKLCELIDLAFSLSGKSEADISNTEADVSNFETDISNTEAGVSNFETDIKNIRQLGKGTTGDSALAIAVYCSLKYENDFSSGVIAAVNHDGDSDSTGAITGNLLGAWLGLGRIDDKWLEPLEMKDIILEMADDLCFGVPSGGVISGSVPSGSVDSGSEAECAAAWRAKYVEMRRSVN